MGRVSLMLTRAAELALEPAGPCDFPELSSGRLGVSCGSSSGSPPAIGIYARQLFVGRTTNGIGANVRGEPRSLSVDVVISNNFAFGGINTSQVFRRWDE